LTAWSDAVQFWPGGCARLLLHKLAICCHPHFHKKPTEIRFPKKARKDGIKTRTPQLNCDVQETNFET